MITESQFSTVLMSTAYSCPIALRASSSDVMGISICSTCSRSFRYSMSSAFLDWLGLTSLDAVQWLVLQEIQPGAFSGDGRAALRPPHAVAEFGHAQRSVQVHSPRC